MIRSLTDSQNNAVFNDVVSAMKPKTFFRHITPCVIPGFPDPRFVTRKFHLNRVLFSDNIQLKYAAAN